MKIFLKHKFFIEFFHFSFFLKKYLNILIFLEIFVKETILQRKFFVLLENVHCSGERKKEEIFTRGCRPWHTEGASHPRHFFLHVRLYLMSPFINSFIGLLSYHTFSTVSVKFNFFLPFEHRFRKINLFNVPKSLKLYRKIRLQFCSLQFYIQNGKKCIFYIIKKFFSIFSNLSNFFFFQEKVKKIPVWKKGKY